MPTPGAVLSPELSGAVASAVAAAAAAFETTSGFSADLSAAVAPSAKKGNWLERVENYSPWNDVFSVEQQETELVIDVPFENRYLFIPYVLGYSWVEGVRLRRINPIRHPYWSWMRAAKMSHKGVRYEGKKVFTGSGGPGVAKYKLARFSIGFGNYPFQFVEDKDIPYPHFEITRNTYWEYQPTSQFLSAEGGASLLKFQYGPRAGQSFRAPFGTPVNQIQYKLHWKWVPYDYIFANRRPSGLYNAINTLNASTIFSGAAGFPIGTLRFDPPTIQTYCSPIRTSNTGASSADVPELLCDVTIPLNFFDPPRGLIKGAPNQPAYVNGAVDDAYNVRGHNLCPDRLSNTWYPARRGAENWKQNTKYVIGQYMETVFGVYFCTYAGTSKATGAGPASTGVGIIDGTAIWSFVNYTGPVVNVDPSLSNMLFPYSLFENAFVKAT